MEPLGLLLAVIIFSLFGTFLGALAGLVPGLHPNNVAYLISAFIGTITGWASALFASWGLSCDDALLLVAALIVSCLMAHLFTSIIPSVFLGAPDPGKALSVLPAHRMLLRGRGYDAVRCSVTGCIGGLAVCIALLPVFRILMGDPVWAYEKLKPLMAPILILIVLLLIVSEPFSNQAREKEVFHNRGRCVFVVEKLESAALVISSNACTRYPMIRPHDAESHSGQRVCIGGVISQKRTCAGAVSYVLEEGGALDLVVNGNLGPRAMELRPGDIVIAEGTVAPNADFSFGLRRKGLGLGLFLASGFLGLLCLESGRLLVWNFYPLGAPPVPSAVLMFPLFCGLFGLPTIILGLTEKTAVAPQELHDRPLGRSSTVRGILTGTLAGGTLGWYPGMTSAHGSVLAKLFSGEEDKDTNTDLSTREFLVSASAVTVANTFFNIVALFVILRARSGALHMAREVLGESLAGWTTAALVPPAFALLCISAVLAAALAMPLTLLLGKKFARLYDRVPYRKLSLSIIALLVVLLFFFSGVAGLAVALLALALGLVAPLAGVRRVHLMGAILLPVILYFLGLQDGALAAIGLGVR